MDLGAVVEVAIGLVFVWIVLSMATIQIQEWISIRLDRRARDLEAALHEMLANPNLKVSILRSPRHPRTDRQEEKKAIHRSYLVLQISHCARLYQGKKKTAILHSIPVFCPGHIRYRHDSRHGVLPDPAGHPQDPG